jgi:hypothetical protein
VGVVVTDEKTSATNGVSGEKKKNFRSRSELAQI